MIVCFICLRHLQKCIRFFSKCLLHSPHKMSSVFLRRKKIQKLIACIARHHRDVERLSFIEAGDWIFSEEPAILHRDHRRMYFAKFLILSLHCIGREAACRRKTIHTEHGKESLPVLLGAPERFGPGHVLPAVRIGNQRRHDERPAKKPAVLRVGHLAEYAASAG